MAEVHDDDDALRKGDVDPEELLRAGLISELIVDLHKLATLAVTIGEGLVKTNIRVEEVFDLRKRNRRLTIAVIVLVSTLTVAVIAAIVGGGYFVSRLTTIAEGNAFNGRTLVECTTPSPKPAAALDTEDIVHECYNRSLEQQGSAINVIGTAMVDAAYCARTEADVDSIQKCFDARRAVRVAAAAVTTTTTEVP